MRQVHRKIPSPFRERPLSRRTRRAIARTMGAFKANRRSRTSGLLPQLNPHRDGKSLASGRLRKELRP